MQGFFVFFPFVNPFVPIFPSFPLPHHPEWVYPEHQKCTSNSPLDFLPVDKPKLNIYSPQLIIFLPQLGAFPVFLTQLWNVESSPLPSRGSSVQFASKCLSSSPQVPANSSPLLPFHHHCSSSGPINGSIKDFPFSVSFIYFILQGVAELFL